MTIDLLSAIPRLRPLDIRPILYEGQPFLYLRDPLSLSDKTIILPQTLAPILMLLDGSRDPSAVSASCAIRFGLRVSVQNIQDLVNALDQAFLLENETSHQAMQKKLADYRQAPYRKSCCAGQSFPADKEDLKNLLDSWLNEAVEVGNETALFSSASQTIGAICPHIDYERGHKTYAALWKNLLPMLEDVELVIIFGTDHYSQRSVITLTQQNYATPFGVLENDEALIQLLAREIGEEKVFAEELHHANEHSIELALIWLHYLLQAKPSVRGFKLLPVLCGDLIHADEQDLALADQVCSLLRDAMQDRKTLVIAAADLSHVGPAFGGDPVDLLKRALVKEADEHLLKLIQEGKAEEFLQALRSINNRHNVCGVTPIYFTLKITQPKAGTLIAHEFCPADEHRTSWVSICGVTLDSHV